MEDTWPIHGTHCTIPKIHKPSKEEFTKKCMEPGLLSYGTLISLWQEVYPCSQLLLTLDDQVVREREKVGSIIAIWNAEFTAKVA